MPGEARDKLFDKVGNVIVYVLGALIVALVVGYVDLWSTVSKLEDIKTEIYKRPDERLVNAWLDRRDTAINNLAEYSQENRNLITRLSTRFNGYVGQSEENVSAYLDLWHPGGGKNPYEKLPVYALNDRRGYSLTKVDYGY